jgi:hypothetical protein
MSSSWTEHGQIARRTLRITKVHIRAFRAIDDLNACERFAQGHAEVLTNHGIKKVSSASSAWFNDPNVYVLLATSPGGQRIYGGARIHIRQTDQQLPLEKPFGAHDPRIHTILDEFSQTSCAELCALWNSVEVAGLGIGSRLIILCGIVLTEQLGIRHLLALSSPVTRRWIPDFGFSNIENIGIDGGIPYPTERLRATVAHFINPECLSEMAPELLQQVLDLRENPFLTTTASGPKGSISIYFDLKISTE